MSINLDLPVDRNMPEWQKALGLLQGNILRSHGRDHTAVILFEIGSCSDRRARLSKFCGNRVTSVHRQEEQTANYRAQTAGGVTDKQLFGNFFLSVWGYLALGFSRDDLAVAFPHPQGDPAHRNWFLEGMEHKGEWLRDPPSFDWEPEYRQHIHALLLLACDDLNHLNDAVDEAAREISPFGRVLKIERGTTRRKDRAVIEPFGFADGISQPNFLKGDDREKPVIVLVADKLAGEPEAFGSYLVYRKLEQNVKDFLARESELADSLGLTGCDRERAGAMVVGRFRDGSPLTKSATAGWQPSGDNDFNYRDQGDMAGLKCPWHAHIRKVRPRTLPRERIVRRGVSYGSYDPTDGRMAPPRESSGMLFLSFQRNIHSQFGSLQQEWCNRTEFPERGTGLDPVGGQGWSAAGQKWPTTWGKPETRTFRFEHFVTLKGGEFFYAPSLAFLQKLDRLP